MLQPVHRGVSGVRPVLDRRGDLSINTIVIAVIALIVLAVLIIIFTNVLGDTNRTLRACEERGGTCADGVCPTGLQYFALGNKQCRTDNPGFTKPVCCLPPPSESPAGG